MMRVFLLSLLLLLSTPTPADDIVRSIRAGQLLVMRDDPSQRALDLLGAPERRVTLVNKFGAPWGERWDYTVRGVKYELTILDGKVWQIVRRR